MNRRQCLRLLGGGIAVGTGTSGLIGSTDLSAGATGSSELGEIDFDRTVNAVDDLGVDPTGQQPIDGVLKRTLRKGGVLLKFPPGTYFVKDRIAADDVTNWGIRGLGDKPGDVRFVSTPGEGKRILSMQGGNGVLIENLTFDYSQRKAGTLGLLLKVNDRLKVKDVHFEGFNPTADGGAVINLSPQLIDPDGVGVVSGVVRKGPTNIQPHRHLTNNPNIPGIVWLGPKHRGRLYIRDSHFENAGENGIYASVSPGDVRVENCRFVNNNQASVRLGGAGSYIRDSDFIVDADEARQTNPNPLVNPNGILWETDSRGEAGGEITGCSFEYRSIPDTVTALWVDGSAGAISIRDCKFRLKTDNVRPICVDDPVKRARLGVTASRPWGATLENITVTGDSHGRNAVIELHRRPGSTVRNSCIQMDGGRDGVVVYDSPNSSVENSTINVEGEPIVSTNSGLATSNLNFNGTCSILSLFDENTDGSEPTPGPDAKTLVVRGSGDGRSDYRIRYDGTASTDEEGDRADDGVIEGSVWGTSTDEYALDGTITEIVELDGATVTLDGEPVK